MLLAAKNLYEYRDLIGMLAWRSITLRYKQAYLGIAWAVLKPLMLVLIFTIMRSFIGIKVGDIPYPILTYAALMPWVLFQESAAEGTNSVVGNSRLIKKIYFPREVFPLTSAATKLVELAISFFVLGLLMAWYGMVPSIYVVWVPVIIAYTMLVALTVSFAGSALNVFYRDVGTALPVVMSLVMYLSPVIYPLSVVQKALLEEQKAGEWSELVYKIYLLNPLAGIIDSFQNVMLRDTPPDFAAMVPGMIAVAVLLPLSYALFKRAESHFADII